MRFSERTPFSNTATEREKPGNAESGRLSASPLGLFCFVNFLWNTEFFCIMTLQFVLKNMHCCTGAIFHSTGRWCSFIYSSSVNSVFRMQDGTKRYSWHFRWCQKAIYGDVYLLAVVQLSDIPGCCFSLFKALEKYRWCCCSKFIK